MQDAPHSSPFNRMKEIREQNQGHLSTGLFPTIAHPPTLYAPHPLPPQSHHHHLLPVPCFTHVSTTVRVALSKHRSDPVASPKPFTIPISLKVEAKSWPWSPPRGHLPLSPPSPAPFAYLLQGLCPGCCLCLEHPPPGLPPCFIQASVQMSPLLKCSS